MPKKVKPGIFFERIDTAGNSIKYPAWRYHALYEPRIVNDTNEDQIASDQGWKDPRVPITAIQGFSNFYHDLEDMNNEQLVYYARKEFDVEFPVNAPKAKLLYAIWILTAHHPKNDGKIVLLAQSIRMNYDETCKAIERMAGDMEKCDTIETEEVWL